MMKIGSFVAALLACVSSVASAQRSTPVQVVHPAAAASDRFASAVAISGDTMIVGAVLDDVGALPDQGSAQVYRWTGSGWTWEASLVATDGAIGDAFGSAVAISGDTVIVGAYLDDIGANPEQGSAYIFVRSGTTWTQQAKLTAPDGESIDLFGQSVSIYGDTVIVGAFADAIRSGAEGSAYVFNRSGTVWTQQAKLTASDGASSDHFGWSVNLFGDYAVIGAPNDDVGANADQGSVYVFARSGAVWTQQSKLNSSDGAAGDRFGQQVAIDNETAVIGAYSDDVGANVDQGSAYTFVRSGATWTQQAKLNPVGGAAGDRIGSSVSISGETVLVGSAFDDNGSNIDQGSAYAFVRSGGVWTQQTKFTAEDGAANDQFGYAVAISGDTAIVGVYFDDVGANTDQGTVRVFTRIGSTWIAPDQKLISSTPGASNFFGDHIAIDGDTAVVGSGVNPPSVYVRSGVSWVQQATLTAPGLPRSDSVAIFGDTAIVGFEYGDSGGGVIGGAAYIFVRSGTTWSQQAKLVAFDALGGDYFGSSVAIDGNIAIVGAINDDIGANIKQGSAYIFVRSGTTWTFEAKLVADGGTSYASFGECVDIDGETVIVGARREDVGGSNNNQGVAFVFTRSSGSWYQQAALVASDGNLMDYFGNSVSISGDTAIVGASSKEVGASNAQGCAYIFSRANSNWSQQAKLIAADGSGGDYFGQSVVIRDNTVIVTATSDDIGANFDQGSAYVFARTGLSWNLQTKLTASDGAVGDYFGTSIAFDGNTMIFGVPNDDVGANVNQGSVWVYEVAFNDLAYARNDVTQSAYSSLTAAMLPATSGQQITATEAAWRTTGSMNTIGRSLALYGSGDIRTNPASSIELGGSSVLASAPGSVTEMNGIFRISSGATGDVSADSFRLGSRGIMTARTNSSLSINAPFTQLDGQTRVEQNASLTFSGTVTAIGSTTANSDSSLTVGETFNNIDAFTITSGTINAPLFFNRAQTNIFGTSALFGSLFNNVDATTTVRSGTLYVFGSLTNNGTIVGTICAGCTSTPPNMDVGGSINLGNAANLNMPFLGSTVRVGGNFDCAINSNMRYDMSLATLQLEGNGSEQTLEVMSLDIGADANGLDRSIFGHYPINTLHIGASPSVVRLVDNHDNDGSRQSICEAIYVDTLRIDAGSRLINTSCKIYYNTLINNGTIDVPSNVISMQPTFCPSDFDRSGGVDGDDVIAFFAAWDAGDLAADFDQSGGVDGDDVIGFFAAWDAGC